MSISKTLLRERKIRVNASFYVIRVYEYFDRRRGKFTWGCVVTRNGKRIDSSGGADRSSIAYDSAEIYAENIRNGQYEK